MKTNLAPGLYVDRSYDGFIVLVTENEEGEAVNVIYIGPEAIESLVKFVNQEKSDG